MIIPWIVADSGSLLKYRLSDNHHDAIRRIGRANRLIDPHNRIHVLVLGVGLVGRSLHSASPGHGGSERQIAIALIDPVSVRTKRIVVNHAD
jgi:hypothetical protein